MTTLYSIPLISGAIGGSLPPLNRSNDSEFGPHPDPKQGAGRRRRPFWGPVDFETRRSFDPFSGGLGLDDGDCAPLVPGQTIGHIFRRVATSGNDVLPAQD